MKTTTSIKAGELLCDYPGEIIQIREAHSREKRYSSLGKGSYMYYLYSGGRKYCLDATNDSKCLGRLINHAHAPGVTNIFPHACVVRGEISIRFYALRDLPPGTELFYDYGVRDAEIDFLAP